MFSDVISGYQDNHQDCEYCPTGSERIIIPCLRLCHCKQSELSTPKSKSEVSSSPKSKIRIKKRLNIKLIG